MTRTSKPSLRHATSRPQDAPRRPTWLQIDAAIEANMLPKTSKFRIRRSMPRTDKIVPRNQRFWLSFLMLFCIGFRNVSVLCRHMHVFKKCTKINCFCLVFEDVFFGFSIRISSNFNGRSMEISLFSFLVLARLFVSLFCDFGVVLGSRVDAK